ncbi:MAG: ABC transporter permease [Candidatus Dojkabacteria bacterium]|nr:ABC transporter permease [Candidatus Dojkabacteria bacterium]
MISKTSIKLTIASIKMYIRDKRALMFTLLVPIITMSIFGILDFSGGGNLKLGIVVADDAGEDIRSTVDQIKDSGNFDIFEGSYDDQINALEDDERDMILRFTLDTPSDEDVNEYAKSLPANIDSINTTCNRDITVKKNLDCIVSEYIQNSTKVEVDAFINTSSKQSAEFALLAIQQQFTQMSLQKADVAPLFEVQKEEVNVNRLTQLDFILPGMIGLTIMQAGLFGVAGTIVSYKEKGILKRLFATPLNKADFLFSNVVTRILVGLLQVLVLFAYPKFANWAIATLRDIPLENAQFYFTIVGNLGELLAVAFIGNIVFICFGFAISSFAKTFDQVQPIIMLIQFPMMFLSGVFFPKEALPNIVQKVADYFPLTFLIDGLRLIMNQGKSMFDTGPELLGLVIWGFLMFVVALKLYKWD